MKLRANSRHLFSIIIGFGILVFATPSHVSADANERPDRPLFATVSGGVAMTCAVTSTAEVKCWGGNHVGQLGNGTQVDSLLPVQVQGLSGNTTSVIATPLNACALSTSGGMKCWGADHRGQLGNASGVSSSTAIQVTGLTTGVKAMAGGEEFTCALMNNGEVKCWGNTYIDVDNDGIDDSGNTPTTISGIPQDIVSISAGGGKYACVLSATSGVWCWGQNSSGQLGDGSTVDRFVPVQITALPSSIRSLSTAQNHSCAVTSTGGVKCWGSNTFGKLGDGTTNNSNIPVSVLGLTGPAISVSTGYYHSCALLVSGAVQCWGWNFGGQLGDGTNNDSNVAVTVQGLPSTVEVVTTGSRNSCALLTNGDLKCWGDNTYGQVGDGSSSDRPLPVSVLNFVGVTTTSSTTSSTSTTQAPATTSSASQNTTPPSTRATSLPSTGQQPLLKTVLSAIFLCVGIGVLGFEKKQQHTRA
jgi:alpha-tubulin suppressor-like RCC1 family protein